MNHRVSGTLIGIMVAAMFVTGAAVYSHLPLMVISHWNNLGHPTSILPRLGVVFLFPLIALVLWGLWALLPRIDPIARGFPGFRHVYDFIWILLTAFFAYVYALTLLSNLGITVKILHAAVPAFALLFFILGALLPLVKRNWFIGIRTPWSLSSDSVWTKTHKFSAPLFMVAGLIILVGDFVPPSLALLAHWFIITPILLAVLISVVSSYVFFVRERKSKFTTPELR